MEEDQMEIDDQQVSENLILTQNPLLNQAPPNNQPLSQTPLFGNLPQQPSPMPVQFLGQPLGPPPLLPNTLIGGSYQSTNVSSGGSVYSLPMNYQPFNMPQRNANPNLVIYNPNLVLNNDEDFELKEVTKIKNESLDPVTVKIKSHPNELKVSNSPANLVCCLSLQGISAEIEEIEQNREGIDLIFVVDISGSMGSGKIDLVKVTIEFVLTILKEFDRVCVIGFSDSAIIYCPLTKMNEEGKLKVGEIVRGLGPTGGTNIESGVRAGLHVLADRKKINQITSIMLLSDGVDNDTRTVNQRVSAAIDEFKPKINGFFKLHTFGYGNDHDSVVMNLLAEQTRGNFYYIEQEESVSEAFSNCMGELVSLVASKIHVSLNTLNCSVKFKLSHVYSKNEDVSFDMPDLFFDDQIDIVFILDFEQSDDSHDNEEIQPIRALVSYIQKGGEKVEKEVILSVKIVGENSPNTINKEVLVESYRVKGALTLKEVTKLADSGNFEQARKVAKAYEEVLTTCIVSDNKKIQYLLNDIKDSQNRSESHNSWNSGGRAQVTSLGNAHFTQQASNNCMMYQKPMQAMYSASSNTYSKTVSMPCNYSGSTFNSIPNHPNPPQAMTQINRPMMPNLVRTQPIGSNPYATNQVLGFPAPLPSPQGFQNLNQVPLPSVPPSGYMTGPGMGPSGGNQIQQFPLFAPNQLFQNPGPGPAQVLFSSPSVPPPGQNPVLFSGPSVPPPGLSPIGLASPSVPPPGLSPIGLASPSVPPPGLPHGGLPDQSS